MKKFLIGIVTGILLAFLCGLVVVFSLARFGDRRPTVSDESTLVLDLQGEIPEKPPIEVSIPFFDRRPQVTVRDVWSMLHNAAVDQRVKAVILMPQGISAGWGKLQEIRQDLVEFKKSGKPLVAFLQGPTTREYYLATAADRIYMPPEDGLYMKGLRAEMMYFKNTLDKVGVQAEFYHIGKYKDFGDMFTQTSMTPETREVMNSMLDQLYAHLTDTFAAARKKTPDEIRAIVDNGPFTSTQAKAKGLIDDLRYEDEVYGDMKGILKQKDLKKLSYLDYAKASGTSPGAAAGKQIALLVGDGDIMRGEAGNSDEGIVSGPFIKLIRKVANDSDVRGVILRVNSPGGDAIASDQILREVKLLSMKKPTVISMSDLAASGGYYISMTGDPIIAYPGTYTGSIGIIFGKVNLKGFYDKIGITKDILTRGKNADIDSDYHPLTDAGREKLRESLEEFYKGFVGKAAASRKKTYDQLDAIAQGRVWLGSQAKQNGLVDDLGGLDKAVELVKQKAGIPASEKIRLVPYPGRRSIFDELLRATTDSAVESKMKSLFGGLDYKLWMRGGIMRVMPYTIDIR
jgi:protease IV